MARDFKHGVSQRETYKRKSQQPQESQEDVQQGVGSGAKLMFLALGLSVVFIGGFWVFQHFATQGVKSRAANTPMLTSEADITLTPILASVNPQTEILANSVQVNAVQPANQPNLQQALNSNEAPAPDLQQQNQNQSINHPIKYTFYQGLSDTEVLVSVEPISIQLPYYYYIQAGSFSSEETARQEQARLLTKGQLVDISPLEVREKTYYRLRMGPYDDRLLMNEQRNRLTKLGVDVLLVRSNEKVPEEREEAASVDVSIEQPPEIPTQQQSILANH